jgi:phosphoglycerate dehydrogenase-like enzyme
VTGSPVIVVEDDSILRLLQVTLDPETPPERENAIADYYSADGTRFDAWLALQRERLPQLYPCRVVPVRSSDELRTMLPSAHVVVVQDLPVGAPELDAAPHLKLVQKFGTMTPHIDHAACAARGVAVRTQARRVNVACAEHAFALLLALAKKISTLDHRMTIESLQQAGFAPLMFDTRHAAKSNWGRVGGLRTVAGTTLGIVGLGEIGRELAKRAAAFDMRVVYYQRNPVPPETEAALGVRYVELDALLGLAGFVSLHLPLNDSTRNLIGARELALMKRGSYLINISRAELVERTALLNALKQGPIAGAGVDMLYEEPARPGDELLQQRNLVCTPHTAVAGRENGLADMADVLDSIARSLD